MHANFVIRHKQSMCSSDALLAFTHFLRDASLASIGCFRALDASFEPSFRCTALVSGAEPNQYLVWKRLLHDRHAANADPSFDPDTTKPKNGVLDLRTSGVQRMVPMPSWMQMKINNEKGWLLHQRKHFDVEKGLSRETHVCASLVRERKQNQFPQDGKLRSSLAGCKAASVKTRLRHVCVCVCVCAFLVCERKTKVPQDGKLRSSLAGCKAAKVKTSCFHEVHQEVNSWSWLLVWIKLGFSFGQQQYMDR